MQITQVLVFGWLSDVSNGFIQSWLYSKGDSSSFSSKTLNLPITFSTILTVSIGRNSVTTKNEYADSNPVPTYTVAHISMFTHTFNTLTLGARYNLEIIVMGF